MLYKTYSDEYFVRIVQKREVSGEGVSLAINKPTHQHMGESKQGAGKVVLINSDKGRALECVTPEGNGSGREVM